MTAPTPVAAPHLLAVGHTSLMHGWIPITVQIVAAVLVATTAAAPGRRSRKWRMVCLPVAGLVGAASAYGVRGYLIDQGLSQQPAPATLWLWIALAGIAATVLTLGWRRAPNWWRGAALLALPLCVLSAALVVNLWVGYSPTVQTAWNQVTSAPLPDQTDRATVRALAAKKTRPQRGKVVPVVIPADSSHFNHREEFVYLPPEWFDSSPPPPLPTVMMIGAEFNTPADWIRVGNAVNTVDSFAAAHHGEAPVLVFVDSNGSFKNDTECVNGSRGNAADHLTKDVVPYMVSNFGVSPDRSNWGVVGWSTGGTCAVDLATMHPEMFSAFVDIAGDLFPNAGNKAQTIARLFGGSADAWAAFDPTTVIDRHGRYTGVAGWFAISSDGAPITATAAGFAGGATAVNPGDPAAAAYSLCALGRAHGIDCAVVPQPGKHDWPFADRAFVAALPWLAGQLGTPGVARIPLPGTSPPVAPAGPVARAEHSNTTPR